jgi:hypothetical protein
MFTFHFLYFLFKILLIDLLAIFYLTNYTTYLKVMLIFFKLSNNLTR